MDDPFVVRGCQPSRNLDRVLRGATRGESTAGQRLAHRLAVEQFHHGVGGLVGAAEVVNGQDVGVRQRGHGLRLALESRQASGRVLSSQAAP